MNRITGFLFLILISCFSLISSCGGGGGGGESSTATTNSTVDDDNDGLTIEQEFSFGSSPANWDTDGDGLGDLGEFQLKTDPTNPDTDGDGQSDGTEVAAGRKPTDATSKYVDNNRDGIADNWAEYYGITKSSADPDHDLLDNLQEFKNNTNPLDWDRDDDTISDFTEIVELHSDPNRENPPKISVETGANLRWGSISTQLWEKLQQSINVRQSNPPVVPQTGGLFSCYIIGDIQHLTRFSDARSDAAFGDGFSWPDLAGRIATNSNASTLAPICAIFVGDLVDVNRDVYWNNFREGLDILDAAGMMYFFTFGNHDCGSQSIGYIKGTPGDYSLRDEQRYCSLVNTYLPPHIYKAWPTYGGSYDPISVDNTWHRFYAAGRWWVVLSIEYNPRDSVIAWADSVIKSNATANVIITTHSYITSEGVYSTEGGQRIYGQIVYPNSNVIFVVGGHHVGVTQPDGSKHPGIYRKSILTTNIAGKKVFELFFNQQEFDGIEGGQIIGGEDGAKTALITFKPATGTIQGRVTNATGEWVTGSQWQFSLSGFTFQ
jgi:hypothetical protein